MCLKQLTSIVKGTPATVDRSGEFRWNCRFMPHLLAGRPYHGFILIILTSLLLPMEPLALCEVLMLFGSRVVNSCALT